MSVRINIAVLKVLTLSLSLPGFAKYIV